MSVVETAYLAIDDPLSRSVAFVGLEVVFLVCGALTLAHAVRALRRGDASALFTWICVFTYGVTIELLSYNFLDSFTHGQFTVMLYHRKLPLYITALYPVFIYTSIATAGRMGLGRVAEPLVVGLFIVVMDFPFDTLGPDAGFWSWSATDPNMAYRVLGVPVTSYYWHLAFGGVMAFLTRSLRGRTADLAGPGLLRRAKVLLALPVTVLTLVLGVVAFLPFHALHALGVDQGVIVAGVVLGAFGVLVAAKKRWTTSPDRVLLGIQVLYYPYFLVLLCGLWAGGALPSAGAKAAAIGASLAVALGVSWMVHRRPRTLAVAAEAA